MKALTPVKLSSSKSYQKILKCTVYLDIHSITCPGALLARPEDIYLSACVMGQYRKTHCVPAIFPLLFNHKMVFVRTFPGVVDPADVSEQLESDSSTLELIQMVPPEGEILATVEEGTRDFVFPGPRLTASEEAPERQLLMRKSSSFPGIAPMVEFSTTAVIEEVNGAEGRPTTPPTSVSLRKGILLVRTMLLELSELLVPCCRAGLSGWKLCGLPPEGSSPSRPRRSPRRTTESLTLCSSSQPSSPATPRRTQGAPGKRSPSNRGKETDKTGGSAPSAESPGTSPLSATPAPLSLPRRRHGSQRNPGQERGQLRGAPCSEVSPRYQRPTAASVARALSPYTHRRMCELSEDSRARLAHLQLGPHHFRKQTQSQPPFLVPFCCDDSFSVSPSYQPVSPTRESVLHRFGSARFAADHPAIALDSSLLGSYRPKLDKTLSGSTMPGLSPDAQRRWRGEEGQTGTPVEKAWSIPGASSSGSPLHLGHSSIQERSPAGPSQWEQIHSRVQRILQTHGTSPKHLMEEEEVEEEEKQLRAGGFCDEAHCGPMFSQDRGSPGEWAEGVFGSRPVASDRFPRPHRAAFEESLGKIYQSMYRRATYHD